MGFRRVWDGGLAFPAICLLVVDVTWVCSASVGGGGGGGGEVPLPVVLLMRFLDGGGMPASPPSYTLQKMCKLIEVMIVIVIIYYKVEYW